MRLGQRNGLKFDEILDFTKGAYNVEQLGRNRVSLYEVEVASMRYLKSPCNSIRRLDIKRWQNEGLCPDQCAVRTNASRAMTETPRPPPSTCTSSRARQDTHTPQSLPLPNQPSHKQIRSSITVHHLDHGVLFSSIPQRTRRSQRRPRIPPRTRSNSRARRTDLPSNPFLRPHRCPSLGEDPAGIVAGVGIASVRARLVFVRHLRISKDRERLLEVAVGSNRRPVADHRIVVAVGDIVVGRTAAGRTAAGRRTAVEEGHHRHNSFGWTCLREEEVCSGIS